MVRKFLLSLITAICLFASATAQNKQVSGVVTSTSGDPIVGATVIVERTNDGATTGVNGQFTVNASVNDNLVVSFIGYETNITKVGNRTSVSIELAEDTQSIDDVIVVAFGTAKKEAFTGSASVVKSTEIAQSQTSNVAQALAGRVAGVQMANSSGQPGSAPTIQIRGIGSISASNDPLYVVDGMPYDGDLANLNSADIESMTVLKDAASNALYGARGANGVIMITTKKGRRGEANINVDMKWGVNSRAVNEYDYITDPGKYYETYYKAIYNNGVINGGQDHVAANAYANSTMFDPNSSNNLGYQVYDVPNGESFIGLDGRLNPNATLGHVIKNGDNSYTLMPDNWNDESFRTSLRQEYNISTSAGTDRSSFYASVGYLQEDGIVVNSDMRRITSRIKADHQVKKWLKVGGNFAYTNFVNNSLDDEGDIGSSGNVFTLASEIAPIYPMYLRDGAGNVMMGEGGIQLYDYGDGSINGVKRPAFPNSNALSAVQLNENEKEGNAFEAGGYADFTLMEGLNVVINAGTTIEEARTITTINPYYGQYAGDKGIVTVQHARDQAYNLQQLITYTKSFDNIHNMDLLVGHEYYSREETMLYGSKENMHSQDNKELAGAIIDRYSNSYVENYNTEGFFARGQYDYDSRYFASVSYRRDGSSNFHPNHRWGNFWSVGGAWIISKESFMENTKSWLDMLKFKASYGSQGNDNIGKYRYADIYEIKSNLGEFAPTFMKYGNEEISWEVNNNLNIGVEFDMFQGRFGGNIDYFNRQTTDLLFYVDKALINGWSQYMANIGDMSNKGIESNLYGRLINKKNFKWDLSLNFTHYRNKITKLPPAKAAGYADGNYWKGEGDPLYTFYMQKYAGVNDQGLPTWYKEVDGELVATDVYADADRFKCGDPIPDLYGGFSTSLAFYGFDVSANFTYQIGGLGYDSGYSSAMTGTAGYNIHTDMLDAWSPENTGSDIPRFVSSDKDNGRMSDRFLTDASYLNLQNVNIGYTLPQSITNKFGVKSLRIYLACDNVWYVSKRQGFDPRQSYGGFSYAQKYSPIRTISGGLNVRF